MRPLWKDVLISVWLGMILPGIVLNFFVLLDRQHNEVPALQAEAVQNDERWILVKKTDGVLEEMELNAYLTGVVLAEMPAEFHEEALKAQAVAARTYTWKAYFTGGKHGDGSVCTDFSCCQAYIAEDDYLSHGGLPENLEKVRRAVQMTSAFVLAYDGELIEATYFSSAGGSTEAAVAVWGTDYPYLQAVFSPEETITDRVSYSKEAFQNRLGVILPEDQTTWIDSIAYTEGGGVASIEIGGESYTGIQLRSLLGLRSTDFQIQPEGENIIITTRGYGHRVGMSQYGANTMAESGSTWQQILQHYYPGTTIFPAY